MKMIEVDVVITHPKGVTPALKLKIVESIVEAVEKHGCSVGGSFELANEPTDTGRTLCQGKEGTRKPTQPKI